MPTPRIAQLAQNRLTSTMTATTASASVRVAEAALCATATKFGPGITSPATYTDNTPRTAELSTTRSSDHAEKKAIAPVATPAAATTNDTLRNHFLRVSSVIAHRAMAT